ncbi:glutathione-specific gamma-glutamylcyclotransferase 1-like [Genypterus blacodes]|uniref:glutathione-specific gamma-glutamylcyclotransferase 1-like n=1 Tax=Genypterus blacodes TaxID=154954 RepID=UPI003F773129
MKRQEISEFRKSGLWIFGYGSLVWNPGFPFKRRKVGYIRGYKRRFWHGDNFYRGDNEKPGRVVTLLQDQEACTWGVAYEVTDSHMEECLKYLNMRENEKGGYFSEMVEFNPREKGQGSLLALVYIADSDNPIYLGPASNMEIGAQIAICSGNTGHNIEYLLRLADFMRRHCPEVEDDHLFSIEAAALAFTLNSQGLKSPDQ